ncbi:hypothetical protein J4E80_010015 [Alternaria sp. BMP 0032]|nr:hypothetical protein J4E80_010015 [Alternaria sp. BMP 0032]
MGIPIRTKNSKNKPMSTRARKFTKSADDTDQPNAFHPADGKGKGTTTDELRQIISNNRVVLRELLSVMQPKLSHPDSPEIARSSSPSSNNDDEDEDPNEDPNEDQNEEEAPVIPYHISALDLAVHDNDPFQLLRTHGSGGAGKHIKKLNDRRMSTEHRKHGAPGFTKKIRLPRCRFGTGRMLDHPRDDPGREVCWFHKQNVDKWDKKCEKW